MNLFTLLFQAAVSTTAASPAAITAITDVAKKPQPNPWSSVILLIVMFLIFYLLLIRPNQKKEKNRQNQIASIAEGDKIITSGGIKGTVVSVKDDSLTIESKGTKLEIVKFAVAKVIK